MKRVLKWFLLNTVMAILFMTLLVLILQKTDIREIFDLFISNFITFQIISGLCAGAAHIVFHYKKEGTFFQALIPIIPLNLLVSTIGMFILYLIFYLLSLTGLFPSAPPSLKFYFLNQGPVIFFVTLVITVIASRINYLEYQRTKKVPSPPSHSEMEEKESKGSEGEVVSRPGLAFREDENHYLVDYSDIFYFSAHGKKTIVHTEEKEYQTGRLLKELVKILPPEQFCRIHKSYIVNLTRISHVQYYISGSYLVFLKDDENTTLPVGRAYAPDLKNRMGMKGKSG